MVSFDGRATDLQMTSWKGSCVLELWVEEVCATPAHLGSLKICGACVELLLVPLAFVPLVPPFHALLAGHLGIRLILINLEAAVLLNLQVFASVLWIVLVHLVCVVTDGQADVVCGLCGLVNFGHIEPEVVCHGLLVVGAEGWCRRSREIHVV